MRGRFYSSDEHLPDEDLEDLADRLALQLHTTIGNRVLWLQRGDVAALIVPYTRALAPDDQQALSWLVWHLFQDAREMLADG